MQVGVLDRCVVLCVIVVRSPFISSQRLGAVIGQFNKPGRLIGWRRVLLISPSLPQFACRCVGVLAGSLCGVVLVILELPISSKFNKLGRFCDLCVCVL